MIKLLVILVLLGASFTVVESQQTCADYVAAQPNAALFTCDRK